MKLEKAIGALDLKIPKPQGPNGPHKRLWSIRAVAKMMVPFEVLNTEYSMAPSI